MNCDGTNTESVVITYVDALFAVLVSSKWHSLDKRHLHSIQQISRDILNAPAKATPNNELIFFVHENFEPLAFRWSGNKLC